MPYVISVGAQNAAVSAVTALIDAGPAAGIWRILDGAQPADPSVAISGQTILANSTFSDPSFGAPSGGTATAAPINSDTSVNATGTATWMRVYNSNGNDPADAVMDFDVGQGSGTINFDNTSFIAGGTAAINSLTITQPAQ